jgi:general secretion pathway protein D
VKYLIFCLAFFVTSAFSANVDNGLAFDLHEVELAPLARVVLEDVAGASVVVTPEVLEDRRPVSFVLRRTTVPAAVKQLGYLLDDRGFALSQVDGVYRITRKPEDRLDVFVYRPKYRAVSYLADLLGGIIPRTAITSQRMIESPQLAQQSAQSQSVPAAGQVADSGTSAFSAIDKPDKDTLVIKAKPGEIAQVVQVLQQVDFPIPELLVKAVLLEVQTGETDSSAVDVVATLVAKGIGSASFNWKGGADASNGLKISIGGIDALWSALSSDKRFKILSAPQIRVKSGGSARFAVGSDTPVLGAIQYQGNGTSQQSVEYKQSGVILDLRPQIRGEQAELKVFQQLSSFAKTENGVNGSPTLMKRELTSTVMVGPKEVILLGGLDQERTSNTSSGFFFMPKWLRSHGAENERTEIVLMLHVEQIVMPDGTKL